MQRLHTSAIPFVLTFLLCLTSLGFAIAAPQGKGTQIEWDSGSEAAQDRAKAESKVLFLAVNMDNELGNDRTVKGVYTDATVIALAKDTVNLVASAGRHATEGDCPRLGAVTCAEHREVDIWARAKVLATDKNGYVVAPQHVWLGPDGKILLSVPYEVTAGELEWCFHEAQRRINPKYAGKESKASKRPLRWRPNGVATPEESESPSPMTEEEALEIVAEIRKGGMDQRQLVQAVRPLVRADLEVAREETGLLLKGQFTVGQGSRGVGRGGGGAKQATTRILIRLVGESSPQSYWEVLEDLVSTGDKDIRNQAIVSMEQLAAPEGLPCLLKQYKKEKDEGIRKNLLRAVATCGPAEKSVRTLLLKASKYRRDEGVRHNAIISLGWLDAHEDVHARIDKALQKGSAEEKSSAILAMAISRDTRWTDTLAAVEKPEELVSLAKVATETLTTGNFKPIGKDLKEIAGDTLPRTRLFPIGATRSAEKKGSGRGKSK